MSENAELDNLLDVSDAINAQNLTLPTGTPKIGAHEFSVALNSSPDSY